MSWVKLSVLNAIFCHVILLIEKRLARSKILREYLRILALLDEGVRQGCRCKCHACRDTADALKAIGKFISSHRFLFSMRMTEIYEREGIAIDDFFYVRDSNIGARETFYQVFAANKSIADFSN